MRRAHETIILERRLTKPETVPTPEVDSRVPPIPCTVMPRRPVRAAGA